MIDVVTHYIRASFIKNKQKDTVVAKVIEMWLSIFGAATTFLMDNGGEFANDEMRELGNQFGINIKHTAAYAPWENGLNERNHAMIDIMMEKMLEETPNVDKDMMLQYAVSLWNCCMYVRGFTPSQLALGQNPKLPSAFNDELPALEGITTSSVIAENLNTIAMTRKAFVQAEISAKLRKALKHPVRTYADTIYKQGDKCFYKLPNEHRWQGPATVVGVGGKVILIKHGSILRRVHPCNLQLIKPSGEVSSHRLRKDLALEEGLNSTVTTAPDEENVNEEVHEDVTPPQEGGVISPQQEINISTPQEIDIIPEEQRESNNVPAEAHNEETQVVSSGDFTKKITGSEIQI